LAAIQYGPTQTLPNIRNKDVKWILRLMDWHRRNIGQATHHQRGGRKI